MVLYGIVEIGEEIPGETGQFFGNVNRDTLYASAAERNARLAAWRAAFPDIRQFEPVEIDMSLSNSLSLSLGNNQGGAGAAVAMTWNPADKSAVTTLTDGDLHATVAFTFGPGGARSTATKTAGKRYYEQQYVANSAGFGIANASASLVPNGPGANMVCWYQKDGYLAGPSGWLNLAALTTAVNEWGGLAVDIAADKFWIRNAAGWDGDPVAGTGGYTLGITGPFYAFFSTFAGNGGEGLANFGATAFNYAVPSGFVAWNS